MKKLAVAIIALLVIAISAFVYAKGTPQYSLYQLKKSVEKHDVDNAMRYVDIDSIVDHLANDLMKSEEMNKPKDGFDAIGQNFAKGLMTMMLPTLKENLRSQFKAAITTPSTESADKDKNPFTQISKATFSDFDIKKDGKLAVITRKNDRSFSVTMNQTNDGHWKIVQLSVPELTTK